MISQKIEENLQAVVESVVNYVGVDSNTASAPLLSYVAGIKPTVATNLVQYRESIGRFKSRQEVKGSGWGPRLLNSARDF